MCSKLYSLSQQQLADINPEAPAVVKLPIPKLVFFSELLVKGDPVTAIDPAFLHTLSRILNSHGFSVQPSWMSVPPDFNIDAADLNNRVSAYYSKNQKHALILPVSVFVGSRSATLAQCLWC